MTCILRGPPDSNSLIVPYDCNASCSILSDIDSIITNAIVSTLFEHADPTFTASAFSLSSVILNQSTHLNHFPPTPQSSPSTTSLLSSSASINTPRKSTPKASRSRSRSNHRPSARSAKLREMITTAKGLMIEIKEYDQNFEKKNGHLPKKGERNPIITKVDEYKTLRNTLRDLAATMIQCTYRRFKARKQLNMKRRERNAFLTNPLPYIEERLRQQRLLAGRSEDIMLYRTDLNLLRAEKVLVKGELKRFDKLYSAMHSRAPERVEKEPLRKLYQRYKQLTDRKSVV